MIERVLTQINDAEARAAEILNWAEQEIRKIETRSFTTIRRVQDERVIKVNSAVKQLEQQAAVPADAANSAAHALTPDKQKLDQAKDMIIDFIVKGSAGAPAASAAANSASSTAAANIGGAS